MRIALDSMGGDHAPAATVEGAVLYARSEARDQVVLVGDQTRLQAELRRLGADGLLAIQHAPHVAGPGETAGASPRAAARPRSSIRICLERLARGESDAAVSAGHTGATLAAARHALGRLPGVERPAIAAPIPTLKGGFSFLLDAGANVGCRAVHLVQYAFLGAAYARRALGVARPRVALLSNGEEPSKGTEITREAFALLERSGLEFRGYLEGKDLFQGEVEVLVTDGFTGNLVLKTCEGAAVALEAMLRAGSGSRMSTHLGARLLAPALAEFRSRLDWAEYGGALLLGVGKPCVVAHGRSDARAIMNALRAASRAAQLGLAHDLAEAAAAARLLCATGMPGRGVGG